MRGYLPSLDPDELGRRINAPRCNESCSETLRLMLLAMNCDGLPDEMVKKAVRRHMHTVDAHEREDRAA